MYTAKYRDLSANDSLNQHFVENFGNSFICLENSHIACFQNGFNKAIYLFGKYGDSFFFFSPQQFFINPQTTGQGVFTQGGPLQVLLQGILKACGVFTEYYLGLLCECGVTVQL